MSENSLELRKESSRTLDNNTRPQENNQNLSGEMGAQQSAFHPALSQIIQNQVCVLMFDRYHS